MKKIKYLAFAILFASTASTTPSFASDACTAPEAPDLPKNGAVLSYEQLQEAFGQVKRYDKQNMIYKTCLDQVINHYDPKTRAQWHEAMEAYNQSGTAGDTVAAAYQKISSDWIEANKIKKN